MGVGVGQVYVCYSACVEARGQFSGVRSLHLSGKSPYLLSHPMGSCVIIFKKEVCTYLK